MDQDGVSTVFGVLVILEAIDTRHCDSVRRTWRDKALVVRGTSKL